MTKANISYDEEVDILVLSKGRSIKVSESADDFIVDFDSNGFVTGFEILDATKNLKLSDKQLKQIKKANLSVTYNANFIKLILSMQLDDKDINIPLKLDLGHNSKLTEKTNFAVA